MDQLFLQWHFSIAGLVVLALLFAFRYMAAGWSTQRIGYFAVAVVLCIACFFSPLSQLSHRWFWAHMAVHVVLLLCVGPMMVLSLPTQGVAFSSWFGWLHRHKVAGWLAGVGIMWVWHIPVVFNGAMAAAVNHPLVSLAEVCSLVGAGILFSAPVIHPNSRFRMEALPGVLYLFTACIGCSLLGLLITFAPVGLYQPYMHPAAGMGDMYAGITAATDQQAAGLIMWVPCCLVYVSGALYLLFGWLSASEQTPLQLKEI